MDNNKMSKFEDYSEALKLLETAYLYDGYDKDRIKYATSYIGSGNNDIIRDDGYSKCVEYDENGVTTWKIVSPKNIFGLQIESTVNHNEKNKVSSILFLNSGRFDLTRILNRFAEIDISNKNKDGILDIAKGILSMNNEEIISKYNISDNSKNILVNSILLDSVLEYLKTKDESKFPIINCNGENGNISLKTDFENIEIANKFVKIGESKITYNISREFPDCKFNIESIKGDNELLNVISNKLYDMSISKDRRKNIKEILNLALENEVLIMKNKEAQELLNEYENLNNKSDRQFDD